MPSTANTLKQDKSATPEKTESPAQAWLRDHGPQLAVVVLSLLTTACYLIGRAWLLGWYEAAGVPSLLFAWSVQDVVIRGAFHAGTWLMLGASIVVALLYLLVADVVSRMIERRFEERARLRQRGEDCDRLSLRRRWAHEARSARLSGNSESSGATVRWRMLGTRGKYRLESSNRITSKRRAPRSALYFLISLCVVGGGIATYMLVLKLLFDSPYAAGAQSFRTQYAAATGQWPPRRGPGSWEFDDGPTTPLSDAIAAGRAALRKYPYVRVQASGSDGTADTHCGWLVQGSGNQVLMLTPTGTKILSFGDSSFSWSMIEPDSCRESR
jgi:hypothetical protein